MSTHISLDIETMGVRPSSAVIAIGAIVFSPYIHTPGLFGSSFYARVSLESCLDAGLTVDASTIEWWMKQSPEARSVLTADYDPPQHELSCVLDNMDAWMNAVRRAGDGNLRLWCHGPSFDAVLLENAFRAAGYDAAPWRYNEARDTRTIYEAAAVDFSTFPRVGVYHNALDDAETQARAVQEAYRRLGRPEAS